MQSKCKLAKEEWSEVDGRCRLLFNAVKGYLYPSARIMDGTKKLKCHPWLALSRHAMPYLLHGIYLRGAPPGQDPAPADVARQAALDGIIEVVQDAVTWTSDVMDREDDDYVSDHEREQLLDKRKLKFQVALSEFEAWFGHTGITITLHQLLHVPNHIFP